MKFWASLAFTPPEHHLPLARAADEAGIDGIMLSDHIFFPRALATPYPYTPDGLPLWSAETAWPDPWVAIGALAAVTTRVHFSTAVFIAPARDLFTVAKQVGTAAVFSENRVHLGVGVGWMREEFAQTGQAFETRGKRLDEMIPALRSLWSGDWAEFHGQHYDFDALRIEPTPSQPVPILCGGHSGPALRRAATLCDGWIGNAYPLDECERHARQLTAMREDAGRGDVPFDIILAAQAWPTPEVCAQLSAAGVTGLLCAPWRGSTGDRSTGAADQRESELQRKIDATFEFAETVVRPAADA